ncbi:OmpA family protein [Terasakiella sp. SH-1]|uniref:OmpA family protein n=1 Tax=Terasakiella sp. SH-1 TaxID=2560057 RepID=UPI0010743067|nr:OmpA family protein [Terasakiella sp. SH-1]
MGKMFAFRKVLLSTSLAVGLICTASAQAQMTMTYDNNVVVDLSVLNDNGFNQTRPVVSTPFSQAKMPPAAMPRSMLHGIPQGIRPAQGQLARQTVAPTGQPQSRIVLRQPTAQKPVQKPMLPSQKSQSIVLTKPAPAPKPVVKKVEVAKAEPKPMVKPAPQVQPEPVATEMPAPAPAPAPAPVKTVEVVKEAPVAPKEMVKKVEAPAPAPQPAAVAPAPASSVPAPEAVMAAAPPPPPVTAIEPKKVASKMATTEKKSKPTATAALPSKSEASIRIAFDGGQSKMPASAQKNLNELASTLNNNPDNRVQLLAYAGGEDLSASKARRLSLSRALAVRSYLINKGVRSTRIDVRALGNKTTQEPFDRVDVQIAPR